MNRPKRAFTALKTHSARRFRQNSTNTLGSHFQPRIVTPRFHQEWESAHKSTAFDPYIYTQGRWLDHDKEKRQARELRFNFHALLDTAVKCSPGAQQVVHCEKREGGFNRIFMMQLDDGKNLVARLPTRIAGPSNLTTSSEVATLKFVRERTKVPVPNVLSSSSNMGYNPVGADYIIMDAVPGVPLKDVWNTMTASQHIRCIKSIAYLCEELCNLSFPGYGSLFLRSSSPQSAIPLDDTYCIGSLCAPHHWGCSVEDHQVGKKNLGSLGPWLNIHHYLSDLVARAAQFATPTPSDLDLLHIAQETQRTIVKSDVLQSAAAPTLMHPDLHTRNIFVDENDPTTVTGFIDWQAAAIEPAFVFAASTPDFAEEIEDLPYDETPQSDSGSNELSARARLQADVQYCVKTWTVMLQLFPKFSEASTLHPLLTNLLAAGSMGWLKDEVSLHSLLTDLGEQWQELGLPGQSLYRPTEEEAKSIGDQIDRMRATQQLRIHLSRLLHCDIDGWVALERWEEVLSEYRAEYRRFIASAEEESTSDADRAAAISNANNLWPYDQR